MRYLILGAGAIGASMGGRLHQQGHDVVLVARGAHLEALQERGLEFRDPTATARLAIRSVGTVQAAAPEAGDIAIVTSKSQHSESLLTDLAVAAPPDIAVVCAQNGVENERLAFRRFANTYGMRVVLAGTHVEPGVVEISTAPLWGILDVGRYPQGNDAVAEQMAQDLRGSGFDARAMEYVMPHKYLKLLSNLSNAIDAVCGPGDGSIQHDLVKAARAEGRAVYEAAGIVVADPGDEAERRRTRGMVQSAGAAKRLGGSSWQSLERGTGNIEADWLNGEIVLLGRMHGVPTPVNERLQFVANRLAREGRPPGSVSPEELAAGLLTS